MEVVIVGIPILLTELHFVEKPVLLALHHLMAVRSMGYIDDPFFLRFVILSTSRISRHQGSCITLFSHNNFLIQVFKDFKYLPHKPLKKHHFASL